MRCLMKQEMERFQESGQRFALGLRDGREIEGYILECHEEGLDFGHGGPLAPEEDEWIPYSQIKQDSRFYYCRDQKKYRQWRV